MIRKRFSVKVSLLLIIFYIPNMVIFAEAAEQPSIVILCGPSKALPAYESKKLVDAAYKAFERSGVIKAIAVDPDQACWSTVFEAVEFSKYKNADYMVYIDLSKWGKYYSYDADLIAPSKGLKIGTFGDKWTGQPDAAEKSMSSLVSNVLFSSLGKMTVNMIIESSQKFCSIFRDEHLLGDTGENGFRDTHYLKKGSYQIRVCKPEYEDFMDTLRVMKNPTNYIKKVSLTPND